MMPRLFQSLSSIDSLNDVKYTGKLRITVIALCSSFVLSCLGISATFVWLSLTTSFFNIKYVPFKEGDMFFRPFKFMFGAYNIVLCSAWILPLMFFCILCCVISKEFSEINEDLVDIIADNELLQKKLASIRRRHLKACELVDTADAVFNPCLAITFATSILGLCLMAYALLVGKIARGDPVLLLFLVVWVVVLLLILGLPSVCAAWLNCKVRHFLSFLSAFRTFS